MNVQQTPSLDTPWSHQTDISRKHWFNGIFGGAEVLSHTALSIYHDRMDACASIEHESEANQHEDNWLKSCFLDHLEAGGRRVLPVQMPFLFQASDVRTVKVPWLGIHGDDYENTHQIVVVAQVSWCGGSRVAFSRYKEEGDWIACLERIANSSEESFAPVLESTQFPQHLLFKDERNAGDWGGTCTCPDGSEYFVGDSMNHCGSLACVGGWQGVCHRAYGPWSGMRAVC